MKKKILAVALATMMVVSSAVSAFAADSLVGSGWWTDTQTSTAQSIEDGDTVTFSVQVSSNDSVADGEYAAFCVEATDGTNYFTGTSDGDCWGDGTDTDGTSTGVVAGGSYTVTITRSGNNWTADIVDDSTGSSILANEMYLEGTSDFGTTTCYIMSQVADLTVDVVTASTGSSDDDAATTTVASSDDDATTAASSDDAATTTVASAEETGDVATFATVAIVVAAAAAIVVLKKRVTE